MSEELIPPIPQPPIDRDVMTRSAVACTDDGVFDGIRSEVQFGVDTDGVFPSRYRKPSEFTRETALAALSTAEKEALASIRAKIIAFEVSQVTS